MPGVENRVLADAGTYFYSLHIKRMKMNKSEGITVKVTGMTCLRREDNVKRNLDVLKGIQKWCQTTAVKP